MKQHRANDKLGIGPKCEGSTNRNRADQGVKPVKRDAHANGLGKTGSTSWSFGLSRFVSGQLKMPFLSLFCLPLAVYALSWVTSFRHADHKHVAVTGKCDKCSSD